jgi:hypothetical protein
MYRLLLPLFVLALAAATLSGCADNAKEDAPNKRPKASGPATAAKTDETESNPKNESIVLVEPGFGIAGVKIDDAPAAMEQVLGPASKESPYTNEATGVPGTEFTYDEREMRILVANDVVQQIEATSPEAATADGVGYGASQAEIKKAFPDAACDEGEIVVCRIGKEQAGEILTDFLLKDDAAYRIVVARLLD